MPTPLRTMLLSLSRYAICLLFSPAHAAGLFSLRCRFFSFSRAFYCRCCRLMPLRYSCHAESLIYAIMRFRAICFEPLRFRHDTPILFDFQLLFYADTPCHYFCCHATSPMPCCFFADYFSMPPRAIVAAMPPLCYFFFHFTADMRHCCRLPLLILFAATLHAMPIISPLMLPPWLFFFSIRFLRHFRHALQYSAACRRRCCRRRYIFASHATRLSIC